MKIATIRNYQNLCSARLGRLKVGNAAVMSMFDRDETGYMLPYEVMRAVGRVLYNYERRAISVANRLEALEAWRVDKIRPPYVMMRKNHDAPDDKGYVDTYLGYVVRKQGTNEEVDDEAEKGGKISIGLLVAGTTVEGKGFVTLPPIKYKRRAWEFAEAIREMQIAINKDIRMRRIALQRAKLAEGGQDA